MVEHSPRPTIRSLPAVVAAGLLVALLGACSTSGSDEGATPSKSVTSTAPAQTTVAAGEDEAFCEAFAFATRIRSDATDAGESWKDYMTDLDDALAVAPEAVADDLEAYVNWGEDWSPTGDSVEPAPAGVSDSFESVTTWVTENC